MTVQEFMRSYFTLGTKFKGVVIVTNDEGGKQKALHSNYGGYDERCIRPEILSAVVGKWELAANPKHIRIFVDPAEKKSTMTVQNFMGSFRAQKAKSWGVVVQRNNGGKLEPLYTGYDGYVEKDVRPEVLSAVVRKWGVSTSPENIWISVESPSLD